MPTELPTSFRLTRELKDDLIRFAKAQGTSVSWLIKFICEQWVAAKKKEEGKKK